MVQYTKFVLAFNSQSFSRPFCLDNSRAKKVSFPLKTSKNTLIVFPPCGWNPKYWKIVFWFSYLWKTKLPTDQKYLLWKGRVKPEVARLQTRWRSSWSEGVFSTSSPGSPRFPEDPGDEVGRFRVFVELSLEEMLRQQQSKACLYHGRDVFKEMSWSFFHW